MNSIRIILVGQPNVGKSSLINSITGASLRVGNFTGVTVEKKEIVLYKDSTEILMTDLPGMYSFHAYSPDELIARKYLLSENYDIIINVIDANALKRNLLLTLQLLDMNKKTILVINMIDEVESKGGKIDADKISQMLGIPVILVSAKKKTGLDILIKKIFEVHKKDKFKNKLQYGDNLEKGIDLLSKKLISSGYSEAKSRFYSIRLLENDNEIYKLLQDKLIFLDIYDTYKDLKESLPALENEFDSSSVVTTSRVSVAKYICKKTAKFSYKDKISDRIDSILMHKIFGLPIFMFFMWLLFQVTFKLGEYPLIIIENSFEILSNFVGENMPAGLVNDALSQGLIPGLAAVLGFLPNILILFMGISILEQSGYIARVAYLLDGILKKFGLPGKAFIPMITGFGCTIPAYLATRTLKNPKDKLITMLIISFFSCSARLPVYILFISAFFPKEYAGNILFLIYLGGIALALIIAKLFRITLFSGQMEPFVMEMPRYRIPSLKRLALEFRLKLILFLKRAGIYIGIASLAIWFLSSYPKYPALEIQYQSKIEFAESSEEKSQLQTELNAINMENSYLGKLGKTIEPIFSPLGFDWKMSVATLTALAAKEIAVSTLATLNYIEDSDENTVESLPRILRNTVDFKTGMAFLIMIMIYSPCLAAISTFIAEIKETKWRLFYLLYPNILAWIIAFIVYNSLKILN